MRFFGFEAAQENYLKIGIQKYSKKSLSSDVDIYFNFDAKKQQSPNSQSVLILYEPESVMPWQYTTECREMFNLVICLNPWRAEKYDIALWEYQPIETLGYKSIKECERKSNVWVMINAHKFSAIHESGYSLRREVARLMERKGIAFELYGHNWNMGKILEARKRIAAIREAMTLGVREVDWAEGLSEMWKSYKSYKGSVENKSDILCRSKFTIVIENDFNTLSEKVFDAIFSLTIPIYVGPDISSINGLEDCLFVSEPNAESIVNLVQQIKQHEVEERYRAITRFISKKDNMDFCNPHRVWENIGRLVVENFN
jgi:hypothetical protein